MTTLFIQKTEQWFLIILNISIKNYDIESNKLKVNDLVMVIGKW